MLLPQADHPAMRAKLNQLDKVVAGVMQRIDQSAQANDTLFLMLGDHGMTPDGNHGGTTRAETHAAMFAYSPAAHKLGFWRHQNVESGSSANPGYPEIAQLDFTATLALLLGVPIPFGNVGSILSAFYPECSLNARTQPCALAHALRVNSWQVLRYLEAYQRTEHLFTQDQLDTVRSRVLHATFELCKEEDPTRPEVTEPRPPNSTDSVRLFQSVRTRAACTVD